MKMYVLASALRLVCKCPELVSHLITRLVFSQQVKCLPLKSEYVCIVLGHQLLTSIVTSHMHSLNPPTRGEGEKGFALAGTQTQA